jgi:protein TonB
MFNNLVESANHSKDMKRKGAFFLATLSIYAVLFLFAGVASIYAYNAHVDNQSLELLAMVTPVHLADIQKPRNDHPRVSPKAGDQRRIATRTETPPSNNPTQVIKGISFAPQKVSPVPPNTDWKIDSVNYTPNESGNPFGTSSGTSSRGDNNGTVRDEPPVLAKKQPDVAKPQPPSILKTSRVLNGEAKYLPKPVYTQLMRTAGAQGLVKIQILIDEAGNVVSAQAVSGNPMLLAECVKAALQAKFTSTKLNDQPVKVSGMIIYNFIRN